MPCKSDYLEPTQRERQLQLAAQLYQWVLAQEGCVAAARVKAAAHDPYCKDDFVPELCTLLRNMPKDRREALVYNAHDPMARKLADWWEEHQKADTLREEHEARMAESKRMAKLKEQALAKLTEEEIAALRYFDDGV